jgi:homoserine O-acetyltransferase/O-succinyltransferase
MPAAEEKAMRNLFLFLIFVSATIGRSNAAAYPPPHSGTYTISSFTFADGETLRNLRLHYETFGTARTDNSGRTTNAVLIIHGTGGSAHQFIGDRFAGVLFKPGGILDARKYFIILPDEIGHGDSSKPSDGLRTKFPHYGYHDMVRATHDMLVNGLHVNHLRLVMGTSMGGMQTWMWGEMYPTMMDALMPLASLPVQISGRNRIWRHMIADLITSSPDYDGGNYKTEPYGLKGAADILWLAGSAPLYDQRLMPTRDAADRYYSERVQHLAAHYDANDTLYQIMSSSDYDPQPDLGKIVAPLLAINSADDQINPPELGILQREIKQVPHGRFVLLPITPQTRGHGTHTYPAIWGKYLAQFLKETQH